MPSPLASTDHALAQRCLRGDEDARRALFRAHRERVHVVLYRVLGSNREMEDLAQEAFSEIFASLHAYRGEASLATWVDRITTRVAYRWLRRRPRPTVHLELVREPVAADDPERSAWLREVARRLYAVLDGLDAKYRVAYALHVIDERPMAEVAALMESTVVATKARVWRARRFVEARAKKDRLLAEYLGGER